MAISAPQLSQRRCFCSTTSTGTSGAACGVPHAWQNLSCGSTGAPQLSQALACGMSTSVAITSPVAAVELMEVDSLGEGRNWDGQGKVASGQWLVASEDRS